VTPPDAPLSRRTPLYDWHLSQGARLVDFAGWEMPIQYSSITEEHQAVRTAAGLFDISHMGRLVFDGPGALDLIQHLFTNDAASMKPGQVRYGLLCNEQGGIRDDVLVYRLPAWWLMVVNASNREKILSWIDQHRGDRDVRVADRTFSWGMVAVQGPRAVEIVAACPAGNGLTPFKGAGQLKYYYGEMISSGQEEMVLSRTGYTGEDGVEVIGEARNLAGLVEAIVKTARRLNIPLLPCGLGARDTLRLEAAMPLYGHELSEDIDPFQAGLAWAVKMNKGDFIGRAALERRRQDSRRRQRVGLEMEGKRIAREGAPMMRQGREVGTVTSGTFTPTLGRPIAMAYVDSDCAALGTVCEVDVRGKPATARVVSLPFYQRKK
jgi:aminomethyltransferase